MAAQKTCGVRAVGSRLRIQLVKLLPDPYFSRSRLSSEAPFRDHMHTAVERFCHKPSAGVNHQQRREEIELTALEFKLLVVLYDRRNRVQSRSVLLDDVWGIKADVTTRTVDTHVKRLREKLGAAGDYVETVRGVGYRFAESPP